MDDDDRFVGRIYSRREALERAAAAGLAVVLGGTVLRTATAAPQQTVPKELQRNFLVATPELIEGPFFADERLERSSLVEGTDRSWVVDGLPLTLFLRVWELSGTRGTPLRCAHFDVWHADSRGTYSGERDGGNGENTIGQKWLRGYQVTDQAGFVKFQTIWPGWYHGRTVHIHFKVRLFRSSGVYDFTSQFFMDDGINDTIMKTRPYDARGPHTTRNRNDGIYRTRQADGSFAGDHLLLGITDDPKGGKVGRFDIAFDSDGM